MPMVMTVRTDSWHYRYCQWIREFWGQTPTPKSEKACPYWQTIIWFTVGAVLTSPLIIFGYAIIKLFQFLIYAGDKLLTDGNIYDYYQATPTDGENYKPNKLERMMVSNLVRLESMLLSSGAEKAFIGFLFATVAVIAGGIVYGATELCILGVPRLVHSLPHIPGIIAHAVLVVGNFGFMFCSEFGREEKFVGKGFAHAITYAAIHSSHWLVWFFTNAKIWSTVLRYIEISVLTAISAFFVGYVYYEINSSDWVVNRRKRLESTAAERKNRREAMIKAAQIAAHQRQLEIEEELEKLEKEKERVPVKSTFFSEWVAEINSIAKSVARNLGSHTEEIGGITYKALGIFPMAWAMIAGAMKGACPQIEFVTPEEIERQKKIAQEKLLAAQQKREAEKKAAEEQEAKLAADLNKVGIASEYMSRDEVSAFYKLYNTKYGNNLWPRDLTLLHGKPVEVREKVIRMCNDLAKDGGAPADQLERAAKTLRHYLLLPPEHAKSPAATNEKESLTKVATVPSNLDPSKEWTIEEAALYLAKKGATLNWNDIRDNHDGNWDNVILVAFQTAARNGATAEELSCVYRTIIRYLKNFEYGDSWKMIQAVNCLESHNILQDFVYIFFNNRTESSTLSQIIIESIQDLTRVGVSPDFRERIREALTIYFATHKTRFSFFLPDHDLPTWPFNSAKSYLWACDVDVEKYLKEIGAPGSLSTILGRMTHEASENGASAHSLRKVGNAFKEHYGFGEANGESNPPTIDTKSIATEKLSTAESYNRLRESIQTFTAICTATCLLTDAVNPKNRSYVQYGNRIKVIRSEEGFHYLRNGYITKAEPEMMYFVADFSRLHAKTHWTIDEASEYLSFYGANKAWSSILKENNQRQIRLVKQSLALARKLGAGSDQLYAAKLTLYSYFKRHSDENEKTGQADHHYYTCDIAEEYLRQRGVKKVWSIIKLLPNAEKEWHLSSAQKDAISACHDNYKVQVSINSIRKFLFEPSKEKIHYERWSVETAKNYVGYMATQSDWETIEKSPSDSRYKWLKAHMNAARGTGASEISLQHAEIALTSFLFDTTKPLC